MFLEGLARQPGDAISMVATPVGRLVLTQGELHSLNGRPRQTLNGMTPSEKLAEVLQ